MMPVRTVGTAVHPSVRLDMPRRGVAHRWPRGTLSEFERFWGEDGWVDRPARVLVVEDDDNVRFVTVAALRLGSFDVEETASGRLSAGDGA
jgi:hypothetical protein